MKIKTIDSIYLNSVCCRFVGLSKAQASKLVKELGFKLPRVGYQMILANDVTIQENDMPGNLKGSYMLTMNGGVYGLGKGITLVNSDGVELTN